MMPTSAIAEYNATVAIARGEYNGAVILVTCPASTLPGCLENSAASNSSMRR